MNLISAVVPPGWLIPLWLLALLVLGQTLRRARWDLLANRQNLNIFLGAGVAVLGLWLIKTGVKPGLSFHMLGATVLTLMFRPAFALIALAMIIGALTVQSGEFNAFPANFLIMALIPVGLSWSLYRLVDGKLPNHLFVYIFLNAFFTPALAMLAVGLASTAFFSLAEVYPLSYLLEEYLPFYFLMGWAEAFATGMIVTLMVVYKPEWVATFDDQRYLLGK
jgi:uncharacterized membrane protein